MISDLVIGNEGQRTTEITDRAEWVMQASYSREAYAMDIGIGLRLDLTPEERKFIDDWLHCVFGEADAGIEWERGERSVVIRADGQIVSYLEIIEREILVGDQPLRVGGIGNVVTVDGWKRRGLASSTMRVAAEIFCEELQVDFGLLICEHSLTSFYERLGWHAVDEPLVVDQPGGPLTMSEVAMVYSCRCESWPEGRIDLRGLPW